MPLIQWLAELLGMGNAPQATIQAHSTFQAQFILYKPGQGTATGTSTTSGTCQVAMALSGQCVGISTSSATAMVAMALSGQAVGTSSTLDATVLVIETLSGQAHGVSSTNDATAMILMALAGQTGGQSDAEAVATIQTTLTGQADGTSSTSNATALVAMFIGGQAIGTTTATGTITVKQEIVVVVIGEITLGNIDVPTINLGEIVVAPIKVETTHSSPVSFYKIPATTINLGQPEPQGDFNQEFDVGQFNDERENGIIELSKPGGDWTNQWDQGEYIEEGAKGIIEIATRNTTDYSDDFFDIEFEEEPNTIGTITIAEPEGDFNSEFDEEFEEEVATGIIKLVETPKGLIELAKENIDSGDFVEFDFIAYDFIEGG